MSATPPSEPTPDDSAAAADPMAALLGGLDLGSIMETAQQLQQQMANQQQALAASEFAGTAASGAVRVVLTGDQRPVRVDLDASVVDPDDAELLGDLIVAAWRDALSGVERAAGDGFDPSGMDLGGMDLGALGLDAGEADRSESGD